MMMNDNYNRIIQFINELYGSYIKVKEIHWNTRSMGIHKFLDDVMDSIMDYIDKFGENLMGAFDDERIGYDVLKAIIPQTNDLTSILIALRNRAANIEGSLYEPMFQGLVNILGDFAEDFNKYIYLAGNS